MLHAEQEAADLQMKAEGLIHSEKNATVTDTAVAMGSAPTDVDANGAIKYVLLYTSSWSH